MRMLRDGKEDVKAVHLCYRASPKGPMQRVEKAVVARESIPSIGIDGAARGQSFRRMLWCGPVHHVLQCCRRRYPDGVCVRERGWERVSVMQDLMRRCRVGRCSAYHDYRLPCCEPFSRYPSPSRRYAPISVCRVVAAASVVYDKERRMSSKVS